MKRVFAGFVICSLFLNCSKKEEKISEINKPYIISYENEKFQKHQDSLKENSDKVVAFPSTKGVFYGECNLIIDKNGEFYYFQKEYIKILCNYGHEKDTLPHFLDLQPKDIIKIPQESLNNFVSENIPSKEENRRILIIASQNDTIKNDYFLKFSKSNLIQTYYIRRTTQEEDTVLSFKKLNKYYDSDSIKWDRTKIRFPTKK